MVVMRTFSWYVPLIYNSVSVNSSSSVTLYSEITIFVECFSLIVYLPFLPIFFICFFLVVGSLFQHFRSQQFIQEDWSMNHQSNSISFSKTKIGIRHSQSERRFLNFNTTQQRFQSGFFRAKIWDTCHVETKSVLMFKLYNQTEMSKFAWFMIKKLCIKALFEFFSLELDGF